MKPKIEIRKVKKQDVDFAYKSISELENVLIYENLGFTLSHNKFTIK